MITNGAYRRHKSHCDCHSIWLTDDEIAYIKQRVNEGWQPILFIISRNEHFFSCTVHTLYRKFVGGKFGFSVKDLPIKGKRYSNGYVEQRGKAGQLGRSIHNRYIDYPDYDHEFGHL